MKPLLSQRAMVQEFMAAFKQQMPKAFVDANTKVAEHRFKMLEEEHLEWSKSEPMSNDLLDALVDILYIAHGNLLALGLPLEFPASLLNTPSLTIKKLSLHNEAAKALHSLQQRPLCSQRITPDHSTLIYATWLAGLANGFDIDGAFAEVHAKNMEKIWTSADDLRHSPYKNTTPTQGGVIVYNDAGKVVKPPSWQPASLHKYVTAALQKLQPSAEVPQAPSASPELPGLQQDQSATVSPPPALPVWKITIGKNSGGRRPSRPA